MASFRISPAVNKDFAELYSYGALNYGFERAARYVQGLEDAIGFIGEFPRAVRERTETRPPVRLYSYESHLIIYRIEAEVVVFLRILHHRTNWKDYF